MLHKSATEHQEQAAVVQWAEYHGLFFYAIPNGGNRHRITGANLKAEGVKKGVPDLHFPEARGGFHSLYIEMKRQRGGRLSLEQKRIIALLQDAKHCVHVCNGADDAIDKIERYYACTN